MLVNLPDNHGSAEAKEIKDELSKLCRRYGSRVCFCWLPDEILIGFESLEIYNDFNASLSPKFSVMGLDCRELLPEDFDLYSQDGKCTWLPEK